MVEATDSRKRLIKLDGEYDLTRKDEIAGLFGSIDGESSVVIDMTTVTYIDSTFLRELSMLRRRAGAKSITLVGANEHVRRVPKIKSRTSVSVKLRRCATVSNIRLRRS